MSKATKAILAQIHAKLAQDMLDHLNSGEADARSWAVIVKFLKDNNIDALPAPDEENSSALNELLARAKESIGQYQ